MPPSIRGEGPWVQWSGSRVGWGGVWVEDLVGPGGRQEGEGGREQSLACLLRPLACRMAAGIVSGPSDQGSDQVGVSPGVPLSLLPADSNAPTHTGANRMAQGCPGEMLTSGILGHGCQRLAAILLPWPGLWASRPSRLPDSWPWVPSSFLCLHLPLPLAPLSLLL